MAERIFFHESVYGPGTIISFEQPVRSQWTIVAKASEKISQVTQADTQDGLGPSYAAARFLCRSQDNQQAFMRIYMQIPYQGTEFASHQVRAQQATRYSHEELAALQTFTKNTSKITPSLLAYKETRQSDQGIIPGGYITYIVWSKVPGIRLANDRRLPRFGAPLHRFWQFSPAEREEIRACFKKEYRYIPFLGIDRQRWRVAPNSNTET